ncbi:MAG: fatty acid desaturase [bacterium]|nr:fatty acid desaturase [bacterium]
MAAIANEQDWINVSSYAEDSPIASPKKWLTKEEVVELSTIKHWRWMAELALTWALMLGTLQAGILAALYLPTWATVLVFVVAYFLMGSWYNMIIQWVHEASHYNFSRNKMLNDAIGDVFAAGPIFLSVGGYRWQHIPHHVHLNNPDKELQFTTWICLRGDQLFIQSINHLLGFWYFLFVASTRIVGKPERNLPPIPARSIWVWVGTFGTHGEVLALCVAQGVWYAYPLLWVLPIITIGYLINNFRTIIEHQASSDICDLGMAKMPAITRVIRAHPVERFLVAPVGFYYHHEHHTWPGIPYHRLSEARKLLEQRGYFQQPGVFFSRGYLRSIWRLGHEPGYGLRLLNPFLNTEEFEDHDHHAH